MTKIPFENSEILQQAKVTIDGVDYPVTPAQMKAVQHYLSAEELNNMQDNIESAINGTTAITKTQATVLNDYFSSIDVNVIQKIGKIVFLNFRGFLQKTVPNNEPFLDIGYRPTESITDVLYLGGKYNYDNYKWFYISPDVKTIRGGELPADNYVHISFIFLTTDN